jgi:hypothetical protein
MVLLPQMKRRNFLPAHTWDHVPGGIGGLLGMTDGKR